MRNVTRNLEQTEPARVPKRTNFRNHSRPQLSPHFHMNGTEADSGATKLRAIEEETKRALPGSKSAKRRLMRRHPIRMRRVRRHLTKALANAKNVPVALRKAFFATLRPPRPEPASHFLFALSFPFLVALLACRSPRDANLSPTRSDSGPRRTPPNPFSWLFLPCYPGGSTVTYPAKRRRR